MVVAYARAGLSWRGKVVREIAGDRVTGNYFDLLGVQPAAQGASSTRQTSMAPGSAPYVVLSDALWRSTFLADPGVVGTTVELDQHPFTVVGVATARFHGTERFVWPDYWLPMTSRRPGETVAGLPA